MDNFNATLSFQVTVELRRTGLGEWASVYVSHHLLGVTDPLDVLIFLSGVEDGAFEKLDIELLEGFGAR